MGANNIVTRITIIYYTLFQQFPIKTNLLACLEGISSINFTTSSEGADVVSL